VDALVVIVGFRNPDDLVTCLSFLAASKAAPTFSVLICENGGGSAFERLIAELANRPTLCQPVATAEGSTISAFRNVAAFELAPNRQRVLVGQAPDNLGFAGGVNAWLRVARECEGWRGAWILNPDTMPDPNALSVLAAYARDKRKGMVGSRIVSKADATESGTRGLRWRKFLASTEAIDLHRPLYPQPLAEDIEAKLDSPSGASLYVTRRCIEAIGLMDESYFLFFEDLEWGIRAKAAFNIGYASDAIVIHRGGTTTGSHRSRKLRSRLSVYLDFRNRMVFTRRVFPRYTLWVAAMSLIRSSEFLLVGAFTNYGVAIRGIMAGLRGETGRPDTIFPELRCL
jgi:GT2 family glycosyltransferase